MISSTPALDALQSFPEVEPPPADSGDASLTEWFALWADWYQGIDAAIRAEEERQRAIDVVLETCRWVAVKGCRADALRVASALAAWDALDRQEVDQ